MRNIFGILSVLGLLAGLCTFASGATMSITGMISDSACGRSHAKMAAEHKIRPLAYGECTLECVKNGSKFVLVTFGTPVQDAKVYKIANQDFAELKEHAGVMAVITGDVDGDTITVSKVGLPRRSVK